MLNHNGSSDASSAARSMNRSHNPVDQKARDDGSRRLTRQELRIEAELQYAVNELGLP